MRRVLFLDVDGVLWGFGEGMFTPNGDKRLVTFLEAKTEAQEKLKQSQLEPDCAHHVWVRELNPTKVGMLAEMLNSCKFDVVLSSTWRRLFSYQEMDVLLNWVNPKWKLGTLVGETPKTAETRRVQCETWLLKNTQEGDLVNAVAVDDVDDELSESKMFTFVATNSEDGLLFGDVQKLMKEFGLRKAGKLTAWTPQ